MIQSTLAAVMIFSGKFKQMAGFNYCCCYIALFSNQFHAIHICDICNHSKILVWPFPFQFYTRLFGVWSGVFTSEPSPDCKLSYLFAFCLIHGTMSDNCSLIGKSVVSLSWVHQKILTSRPRSLLSLYQKSSITIHGYRAQYNWISTMHHLILY